MPHQYIFPLQTIDGYGITMTLPTQVMDNAIQYLSLTTTDYKQKYGNIFFQYL